MSVVLVSRNLLGALAAVLWADGLPIAARVVRQREVARRQGLPARIAVLRRERERVVEALVGGARAGITWLGGKAKPPKGRERGVVVAMNRRGSAGGRNTRFERRD